MKHRLTLFIALFCACIGALRASTHYAGGDISLLPEYENAGSVYLNYNGGSISGSALDFFVSEGMNVMRVRLFVDPSAYLGSDKDENACQTLDYIIPLCKRIKEAGSALMLDFHYSDTWADPVKQWTPAAWVGLSDDELYQKIYDYTYETLTTLKDEGITPDFIQTGNEISYGMLWGAWNASSSSLKKCYSGSDDNWPRFITLLKKAGQACREVCPNAKIVLHTERVAKPSIQNNFYTKMQEGGVDYDVIGLSYYPYFHGNLAVLETAINNLESRFPTKEIMVVETGYSYKWEVPGTTYDYTATYPYSSTGQKQLMHDMVSMLQQHNNVTGIIWWWPEYNAYRTSLSGWYNAALFDSTNGRACPAIQELAAFASDDAGINGIPADALTPDANSPAQYFDLQGRPVANPTAPGLYLRRQSASTTKLLLK
jgi:arabinogalactan endo-1,4-beta-galactosidase